MPALLEEAVRQVLVPDVAAHLGARWQHERRREVVAGRGDDLLVEIGQRHDQADVVLDHERGERRDVARVVDPRDERCSSAW